MSANRITSLDGLRGIAAISVVMFHINHSDVNIFNTGYFAVDLFFEMSGYVLALNYANSVSSFSGVMRFYRNRAWRLLPLHLVGCLLGIGMLLSQQNAGYILKGDPLSVGVFLKNIMLLPDFSQRTILIGHETVINALFPFNDPAWSLHLELLVSLVFPALIILLMRKASTRFAAIAAFSMAFIGYCLWFRQISPGSEAENYIGGILRVLSEFCIGVGIYYMRQPSKKLPGYVLMLLFFSVLCTFSIPQVKFLVPFAWFICIFIVYPFVIHALSCVILRPQSGLDAAFKVLGDVSYPVYILHFPVYVLSGFFGFSGVNLFINICMVVLISVFSWLVYRGVNSAVNKFRFL